MEKTTKRHCQACQFLKHGIKTRKSIPHTCDKTHQELFEIKKEGDEFMKRITVKSDKPGDIHLSENDMLTLLQEIKNPTPPNETLKEAMKKYNENL